MDERGSSGAGCLQRLIVSAALVWFAVVLIAAPFLVGAPIADPPESAAGGAAVLVASLGAVVPFTLVALLLRKRRGWESVAAAASALAVASGYVVLEAGTRLALPQREALIPLMSRYAVAGLQLLVLVPYVLLAAWFAPKLAGVSRRPLVRWLGLGRCRWSTCLLALAVTALVTLPWPVTGSLGDSLTSLAGGVETLASLVPQLLIFWGVVFTLLTASLPRTERAAVTTMLLFSLSALGRALPGGSLGAAAEGLYLLPLAFLLAEMRARGGNVLPLVPLILGYVLGPELFVDPRDLVAQGFPELQHVASYGVVAVVATVTALMLWLGRRVAKRRRGGEAAKDDAGGTSLGLVGALAAAGWGLWLALYVFAGEPGFSNHGFLIILDEQADLAPAQEVDGRRERMQAVYDALVETADATQGPIRRELEAMRVPYRPYYIINMVRVDGHRWLMGRFEDHPGVAEVILNPSVRPYPRRIPMPVGGGGEPGPGIEENLSAIDVERAWDLGARGEGIVVGGQDTGYDWDHPALRTQYRGWDGEEADHNTNWHDAWDGTEEPFDDGMHGTHTMGIVLGDDGGENQVGVAPEARWIGCRNMRRGFGNPGSYAECMEFLLAPYPHGGDPFRDGDVTLAAHVVNNSWGCPRMEGCFPETLRPAVEALRAAGIMMVVSAGNDGPSCGTASTPPANYDAAFSVGATTNGGQVTGFSSRGPVDGLIKPDIAAPGALVRSSVPGGGYGTAGGTSMAGPHVAGAVALIWSAESELIGYIAATEDLLCRTATATPVSLSCAETSIPTGPLAGAMMPPACACGGVSGAPNNVYGCGLVNAGAAVEALLQE